MKVSFRKAVLWAVVVVVLVVVFIQPSTQRGKYVYDIQTISSKCSFDENPEQDIRAIGKSIVITMPIQTPTPCYEVKGSVDFFGSDIVVNLKTEKKGEVCVECIGVVAAKVTISNLDKGTYNLQVNSPDKSIITTIKIE